MKLGKKWQRCRVGTAEQNGKKEVKVLEQKHKKASGQQTKKWDTNGEDEVWIIKWGAKKAGRRVGGHRAKSHQSQWFHFVSY